MAQNDSELRKLITRLIAKHLELPEFVLQTPDAQREVDEFEQAIAAYKDKGVEEARARVFDELTAPTERGYEPTENIVVQRVYDMKLGQLKGEK